MARPQEFPRTALVVVTLIVSVALWGVMMFWTLAYLRRIAGGLEPFDLRPFGYSVEEARAFLAAISEIGRAYYADVQLQFDTIFPALYAISRGLLLVWVTQPGRLRAQPLPVWVRSALLALPVITAWCDYLENAGIAEMLAAGPQVAPEVVARASGWTQAKSLAALATEVACILLLAMAFVRWRRRRS